MTDLPKRLPGDGDVGVERMGIGDYMRVTVNGQTISGVSPYQCARLVILLCLMNSWSVPKALKGLKL